MHGTEGMENLLGGARPAPALSLENAKETLARLKAYADKHGLSSQNLPDPLKGVEAKLKDWDSLPSQEEKDKRLKEAKDLLSKFEDQEALRNDQKLQNSFGDKSNNKLTVAVAGAEFQLSGTKYDLTSKVSRIAKSLFANGKGPLEMLVGLLILGIQLGRNDKFAKAESAFKDALKEFNQETGKDYILSIDNSGPAPKFSIKTPTGEDISEEDKTKFAKLLYNEGIKRSIDLSFKGIDPSAENAFKVSAGGADKLAISGARDTGSTTTFAAEDPIIPSAPSLETIARP